MLGGTYHYFNARFLPFAELTEAVREAGFPVRALPYSEWRVEARAATADPSHPIYPLLPLFPAELTGNLAPHFATPATDRLMAAAGAAWPDPDRAYVRRTISYFIRRGVLTGTPAAAPELA